uniref:DUF1851 domain-containing protein n=1 Tax=Toxocara canis TaxID=6265 RepID=A0A183U9E3_TOXCA
LEPDDLCFFLPLIGSREVGLGDLELCEELDERCVVVVEGIVED